MKKKRISGILALGMISMLCGFDSAQTAESVAEKMVEASSTAEGIKTDIDFNLDAAVNISDGSITSTISIASDGTLDAQCALDPYAAKVEGTMNLSALTTMENITEEIYIVADEDGSLKLYTKTQLSEDEEGEWLFSSLDSGNGKKLMQPAMDNSSLIRTLNDCGIALELASEAADVNGAECYLLSSVVDVSAMETVLNKVTQAAQETLPENISAYLSMLDGLQLKIELYVDTTSFQIVKIHMDLNGSDLSLISEQINTAIAGFESDEAPSSTAELVLNDASMDILYSYGEAPEITVPDDALAAENSGESISLDDLIDAAGDAAAE